MPTKYRQMIKPDDSFSSTNNFQEDEYSELEFDTRILTILPTYLLQKIDSTTAVTSLASQRVGCKPSENEIYYCPLGQAFEDIIYSDMNINSRFPRPYQIVLWLKNHVVLDYAPVLFKSGIERNTGAYKLSNPDKLSRVCTGPWSLAKLTQQFLSAERNSKKLGTTKEEEFWPDNDCGLGMKKTKMKTNKDIIATLEKLTFEAIENAAFTFIEQWDAGKISNTELDTMIDHILESRKI